MPETEDDDAAGKLSTSRLLAATGEFDIASIQFLNLADSGLDNIRTLKSCTSLIRLDLRQNELSNLNPLRSLKALTALNLSANRITNIDPLSELESLTDLNLSGNLIGSFARLQCLQYLEHFEKLRLCDSVKKLSNPICHDLSYEKKIKDMFPRIVTLDGMTLKGVGSQLINICRDLDEQIENLKTPAHDEYCPCSKCTNLPGGDERTFGPVEQLPIPSAWLRPGYFSLPAHSHTESYAITEFKETVKECKKSSEAAKEHIEALSK